MSDTNKNTHENNGSHNQSGNGSNSLFLYTALIFLAAIIIIIFAYFAQTNVERSQPSASDEAIAASAEASPDAGGPQGIAKTAAEVSQYNLELLEENRMLHNRVDELEAQLEIYEPLTEAYYALSKDDKERIALLLEDIDYDSLSDEAKTLYDFLLSNIQ